MAHVAPSDRTAAAGGGLSEIPAEVSPARRAGNEPEEPADILGL